MKKGEPTRQPKDVQDSPQQHNEAMKRFQLSHPKIGPASPQDIIIAGGHILAAAQTAKLAANTQN